MSDDLFDVGVRLGDAIGRAVYGDDARAIRTVCGWCEAYGRTPAAVIVDAPLDARGLSHGVCADCVRRLTEKQEE